VQQHWSYYRQQLSSDYKSEYQYAGIRYTNWEKIPLLGAIAYQSLRMFKGDAFANHFSLRPYLLDHYRLYKYILLAGYICLFVVGLLLVRKKMHASNG